MDIFKGFLINNFFAHRGLHDKNKPENSLAAFKAARDGFYGIELDVQMLADGNIVVFHDQSLSRMTGRDGYIQNLKTSDLKDYKLLGSEENIPTLDEVFKLINGEVPLLIEIKNSDKVGEIESALLKKLMLYKGEFAIMAFNPYVLGWFKNNAPEILRGQLGGSLKDSKLGFIKKFALRRMSLNKSVSVPHFIAYEADCLPTRFMRKYKDLPLLAWTVRSQEEFKRVIKYSDNIIFEGFEPKI